MYNCNTYLEQGTNISIIIVLNPFKKNYYCDS